MIILSQVWDNLKANKIRSFLTMFGIVWGVISIVILSALNEGFQRGNEKVLRELGRNILIIRNGRTSLQAGGERAGRPIRLQYADALGLKEHSRLLEHITPELMRSGVRVKSRFNSASLQMSGIWPVFQTIRTIEVDRGRLITEPDNAEARRVVVIGIEAARQLFADRDPVGSEITLNGIPYTIIGKIRKKEQDSNYTGADNFRLFVPYETMRKDFPLPGNLNTPDSLSAIIAAPYEEVAEQLVAVMARQGKIDFFKGGPLEDEIRGIIGKRHNFDRQDKEALSIWNTSLESVLFHNIIKSMNDFFVSVSIITLALGGIGVMNIMLIAVKERTKEIGLRKALGATPRNVQWQFFGEGLALTVISGLLGLVLALVLSELVNLAPMPARFAGMIVTWQTTLFSIAVLIVIGVAAATYPARKAAELQPVEALRFEM
ncbi:MAG: ABC transporter permease [Acidobacteria bacterium]|nr:ABC transporter permease [Acidobacteriota bacterium]